MSQPCSDEPEGWFPEDEEGEEGEAATITCFTRCPQREDCLNLAMENDERFGIWGGWTTRERDRLRRVRTRI